MSENNTSITKKSYWKKKVKTLFIIAIILLLICFLASFVYLLIAGEWMGFFLWLIIWSGIIGAILLRVSINLKK